MCVSSLKKENCVCEKAGSVYLFGYDPVVPLKSKLVGVCTFKCVCLCVLDHPYLQKAKWVYSFPFG